jgi:hypothetical protein
MNRVNIFLVFSRTEFANFATAKAFSERGQRKLNLFFAFPPL